MGGKSWFVLATVGGTLVLAVAGLFHASESTDDNPSFDDWRAAAAVIQSDFQGGDGVRIDPVWRRDGAALIVPLEPGTTEPSGLVDLSTPPDPMFVARHRRLWLVSAMGREDRPEGWDGLELEQTTQISDDMTVSRYSAGRSPILVDLLTQVPLARVERVKEGKPLKTCRWRDKVHRCHGRAWEDVSVIFSEVGGAPRRCLRLHPYPDNSLVRVVFDDQTLGKSLLIRSGITLEAARRVEGSDAIVIVTVNETERLRWREPRNGWEWTSHWIDTTAIEGQSARITVEVFAVQEQFRDVCIDAYLLSTEVPGEHR